MTAKLITNLTEARVSVVEGESDTPTDAVLKVSYRVRDDGYRIEGPVRLTDSDGKVIWADDVRNSRFARSTSSSFVENVARKVEAFLFRQK